MVLPTAFRLSQVTEHVRPMIDLIVSIFRGLGSTGDSYNRRQCGLNTLQGMQYFGAPSNTVQSATAIK